MELFGNTRGLGPLETKELLRLYRRKLPLDELSTPEVSRSLAQVTRATGRQVGLLVDRTGQVQHVIVGDASKLLLPDMGRLRAGSGRLRGLRLIHTHLRNEPLTRDDIVDLTRLRLDLIAALCLAPDGGDRIQFIYYAHVNPSEQKGEPPYQAYGPIPVHQLDVNPSLLITNIESELARAAKARPVVAKDGRAILVHVSSKKDREKAESSLRELRELARTAGVEVADEILQFRDQVDPRYVVGKGKLENIVIEAMARDVEVLIFDHNLRPVQASTIAALTDLKIIDRTQLILDIFAQRASSRDGKLQVELAQMKYLLPRLGERDDALSRLTGGIGGRGPGETKLEIGRRRARERIHRLEQDLKSLSSQRKHRRSARRNSTDPMVAVVGYTNAGKTTLLNALTNSSELAEDKLFATLDTRSRRCWLAENRGCVLTDTVGFIRELPEDLFAAFRATFEEAADADVLLHLVDISSPDFQNHIQETIDVLSRLGLADLPRVLVFNKIDLLEPTQANALCTRYRAVPLSACSKESVSLLRTHLDEMLLPMQTRPDLQAQPAIN